MMDLGPHAIFIIWAYVGVVVAVFALICAVRIDARRVARRLAALEAQGLRRRSDAP
ncbi:heme exporter protein CcmD [Devosia algicola]|uniref:Heme exporter protein D n=1 Tax=Devosia algicola TaxID=3026418 RepID=A0ABY7YL48_9HYPH|nr:heme exporter protein CcmD [Devosia algicola]WDR01695.1 heme exporter protein CcmD [Devosia algicola]